MDVVKWLRLEWDRVAAWVLVVGGVVALIVGWIGVSGTAYSAEQLPYIISGGVGGVILIAVGAALWLSADLRDEWHKLDRIEEAIRESGTIYIQSERESFIGAGDRSAQNSGRYSSDRLDSGGSPWQVDHGNGAPNPRAQSDSLGGGV
jgi:hypothetical protein